MVQKLYILVSPWTNIFFQQKKKKMKRLQCMGESEDNRLALCFGKLKHNQHTVNTPNELNERIRKETE